ncbi:MAG TPA: hypothetical protein VHB77_03990, partial [Planctomycetaceae bacterium]|nr:hypothetical protein [Planctomycetaceae bacterium]
VLDRGPYELPALRYQTLPDDIGLISTIDTVLQLTEVQPREAGKGKYALQFFNLRGFRLHGFRFRFQGGEDQAALAVSNCSAVVIEDCLFQRQVAGTGASADLLMSDWDPAVPPIGPRIRRCVFSGELSIYGSLLESTVIEECWFRYTGRYTALTLSRLRHGAIVRRNVFETDKGAMYVEFRPGTGPVEISNNFIDAQPISVEQPQDSRVVFVNNAITSACYPKIEPASLPDIARKWEVANNAYRKAAYSPKQLPLQSTDLDQIDATALDRTSPDYARVALDSPLAQKGAGGKWPKYIGALPPGPAPKDGDWFSHLRERWEASAAK